MAKKDFKNNPALQFITQPTDDTDYTHTTDDTEKAQRMRELTAAARAAKERKQQERKNKRLNLLMQPSTVDALNKIAYMDRRSLNDLINAVLKQYAEDHADQVQKYNAIFADQEDKA